MTLQEAIEVCRRDENMCMISVMNKMLVFNVDSGMIRQNGRIWFTPDIGAILGEWEVTAKES